MTNHDYWQTFVGEETPEAFLRAHGTADPDLALERFLEERGQVYGVINQGRWKDTFDAPVQFHILTTRVYLRSYLEETREEWQPAVESQPPKVVRRYRPVYDLPVVETPDESDEENTDDASHDEPYSDAQEHDVDDHGTVAEEATANEVEDSQRVAEGEGTEAVEESVVDVEPETEMPDSPSSEEVPVETIEETPETETAESTPSEEVSVEAIDEAPETEDKPDHSS